MSNGGVWSPLLFCNGPISIQGYSDVYQVGKVTPHTIHCITR